MPKVKGLIEAYWNVNTYSEYVITISQDSLIEAYWNVNKWGCSWNTRSIPGLIEAYWNVNVVADMEVTTSAWFNRSLKDFQGLHLL